MHRYDDSRWEGILNEGQDSLEPRSVTGDRISGYEYGQQNGQQEPTQAQSTQLYQGDSKTRMIPPPSSLPADMVPTNEEQWIQQSTIMDPATVPLLSSWPMHAAQPIMQCETQQSTYVAPDNNTILPSSSEPVNTTAMIVEPQAARHASNFYNPYSDLPAWQGTVPSVALNPATAGSGMGSNTSNVASTETKIILPATSSKKECGVQTDFVCPCSVVDYRQRDNTNPLGLPAAVDYVSGVLPPPGVRVPQFSTHVIRTPPNWVQHDSIFFVTSGSQDRLGFSLKDALAHDFTKLKGATDPLFYSPEDLLLHRLHVSIAWPGYVIASLDVYLPKRPKNDFTRRHLAYKLATKFDEHFLTKPGMSELRNNWYIGNGGIGPEHIFIVSFDHVGGTTWRIGMHCKFQD